MTTRHETAFALSAVLVIGGAGLLALSILATAIGGMKFGGDMRLAWSDQPLVLVAELVLAGLAVAAAIGAAWRMRADSTSRPRIVGWLGLGLLAIGAVSLAAAWAGFQVASPGIDVLERGEVWYVIGGVPAVVIGLLLAIGGFAFAAPSGSSSQAPR